MTFIADPHERLEYNIGLIFSMCIRDLDKLKVEINGEFDALAPKAAYPRGTYRRGEFYFQRSQEQLLADIRNQERQMAYAMSLQGSNRYNNGVRSSIGNIFNGQL